MESLSFDAMAEIYDETRRFDRPSFDAALDWLDSGRHDRPGGPGGAVDVPNQVYFVIARRQPPRRRSQSRGD